MSQKKLVVMGIAGLLGLLVLFNSVFIVSQTEQALVLQFGEAKAVHREPGLKFKVPFVQNVVLFDKRLLDFNADPKEVIASDQKRLIVDAFMRYRITDPLKFYQSVGNERIMNSRLLAILESGLRQVLGNVPLSTIVSDKRAKIMHDIRTVVNRQAQGHVATISGAEESTPATTTRGFGIEVVDVRIMRADLPQENSEAIFRRMQTEREREAKETRAEGDEAAQGIRSRANRERTELLATAKKQAEITRGEGDAEATKIFADAFKRDKSFFEFYRSLQAYRTTMTSKDTTLILSPKSEFLQHFDE